MKQFRIINRLSADVEIATHTTSTEVVLILRDRNTAEPGEQNVRQLPKRAHIVTSPSQLEVK